MKDYLLILAVFLLAGCEGPVGPEGPAGPQGSPGAQGPQGQRGADGQDAQIRIASQSGTLDGNGQEAVFFAGFRQNKTLVQCWQRENQNGPWQSIASDFAVLNDGQQEEDVLIISLCITQEIQGELGVAIQGLPNWQFLVVAISD